jgi:hypothetical protein
MLDLLIKIALSGVIVCAICALGAYLADRN